MVTVVTAAVPVPVGMAMTVPTVSRWCHHDRTVGRVNRIRPSHDDRRGPIDVRRTWRRGVHHRGSRCANHWGRTKDRQADGDAHAPTRLDRGHASGAESDCNQTEESSRFHAWRFDGQTLGNFSFGGLIESGGPSPESMEDKNQCKMDVCRLLRVKQGEPGWRLSACHGKV